MGPLSLDVFKKNNLSASWKIIGAETPVVDPSEVRMTVRPLTVIPCQFFVVQKPC